VEKNSQVEPKKSKVVMVMAAMLAMFQQIKGTKPRVRGWNPNGSMKVRTGTFRGYGMSGKVRPLVKFHGHGFALILCLTALCWPARAQTVTSSTSTTAPPASVAGFNLGNIVYQVFQVGTSNLLKRVDGMGGYGIMWDRIARKSTEAYERGGIGGVGGEVFSHRFSNGVTIFGDVDYGVMDEPDVARQIVSSGFGGKIPIGAGVQNALNAVGDFKDQLPGVSIVPVNPRIIQWRIGFLTRTDAFTPGVGGQVSIPIGN
jgi:hypothetical protein